MAVTPAWHTRPIFITSTFRDMHAERDHLRAFVFPELEERLKARRTHLEPIDLRWGVETITTDEEHAKEMLVLKVCLAEVERSRPFLIGLIGDRYGWIPPEERMAAAAQEAGFKQPVAGRSVTDLEINFGVLDSPEQKQRSFFYFREPLPYDEMSSELAAQYSDAHNPDLKDAADKLVKLKQQIEIALPDRVRHYNAKWDATNNEVSGLEAWGQQVLKDLWQELDQETRAFVDLTEVTWRSRELFTLEQFIENRAQGFVGRQESLKQALELATSPDTGQHGWGLGITGKPGTGKSAVFSELNRRLNERGVMVLAHAAGISPSSTQIDQMLRRWIDELAQVLDIQDPIPEDAKADDVEEIYRSLLNQVSTQQRVVVLIDALNQFERTNRAKHLVWLPKPWPDNARLITTAIPGTETEVLFERDGINQYELPLLGETDARDIATHICDRYHRKLNPEVLDLLLAKQTKDDQPSYGNPLWLSMAIEEINLLDADDFARAEQQFTGSPEDKLHQLIVSTAKELPSSVTRLYGWMLDRAEDLFGKGWVQAFVNLITVSRSGWREKDFESLIPTLTDEPWDNLTFAALRRTFRSHITQKGSEAQWDFTHAQMRIAVEHRNLTNKDTIKTLHRNLSDLLLSLEKDDALHETETMFHLYQADDKERAAKYYGGELYEGEIQGATRVLATEILNGEGSSPNQGLEWAGSLSKLDDLGSDLKYQLTVHFQFDLLDALENTARLDTRMLLMQVTEETLQALTEQDPDNTEWKRDLSVSHNRIGDIYQAQGNLGEALAAYQASMAIRRQLAEQDPGNAGWQNDLSIGTEKIGDIYQAQGNLGTALTAYRASMAIREQLAEQDPGNATWQRDLSISHSKTGDIFQAQGNLGEALTAYRASMAIAEHLVEQELNNAVWQRDLSVSRDRMGEIYRAQGNLGKALGSYQTSIAIREHLAEQDPDNTEWQRDLSISHDKIGDIYQAQGNLGEALTAYRASMAISGHLAEQDPGNATWQRDLSISHERIGNIYQAQGNLGEALTAYQAVGQLAEQDPGNAAWQRDLSVSHEKIGEVYQAQGNLGEALTAYQASMAIRRQLAEQDPGNADWQRDLSVNHNKIGEIYQAQGDLGEALTAYQVSKAIREQLAEQVPDNAEWQHDLSISHNRIGELLQAQGNLEGALAAYEAYMVITKQLAGQDPSNADWQRNLSISHERIGQILQAQGNLEGALAAYEAYMVITKQLASQDPSNAGWQRDLAFAFYRLANVSHALEDSETGIEYLHNCYMTFQQMKQSGMYLDPQSVQLFEQLDEIFK